jgi:hypothetical protein
MNKELFGIFVGIGLCFFIVGLVGLIVWFFTKLNVL